MGSVSLNDQIDLNKFSILQGDLEKSTRQQMRSFSLLNPVQRRAPGPKKSTRPIVPPIECIARGWGISLVAKAEWSERQQRLSGESRQMPFILGVVHHILL
jgi:hypothetical protein